jgi:PAS domain S-box-containing protein
VAYQESTASGGTEITGDATPDLKLELVQLRTMIEELQRQNAELATLRLAFEAERRRYLEVFESAPDGYLLTTLGGVILEANRAAAAILGVRPDFLRRKSLLVFTDEEGRAELEAQFAWWQNLEPAQADRQQTVLRGRTYLRVHKGASFPAEYTISPARNEYNQLIGLRWMLRDLSENTRTEQALRERDYHYRTLFDNAGDAIFIHNLTGRFLEVNRVACEFLGYTREELLLMTPADVTAPELVAKLPVINAQLQHEDHIFFELVLQRHDGTMLPMELNSRMIEYAGGPAVLSIGRDITERKRGEEALARWAAQLALLSDIGRRIAAILGLAQVFEQAARLVQENFSYHHVALFVVDHERNELVMKAIAGNFVSLFPHNHRIPLGQGMVGWVGEHGRRLLADDVENEPHYINFYPDLIPTRSELSVPIRTSDRTVGVLDVQSPELNAFDENDTKVMEILADQIAVAMANAQLYEAAQEARRMTGRLNPAHVVDSQP